jgi:hypothetical protein
VVTGPRGGERAAADDLGDAGWVDHGRGRRVQVLAADQYPRDVGLAHDAHPGYLIIVTGGGPAGAWARSCKL